MGLSPTMLAEVTDGVSAWRAFAQSVGRTLEANAALAPILAIALIAAMVLALDVLVARRLMRRQGGRDRNPR